MYKLSLFCLLAVVWITLVTADCKFNFGSETIDLSGVGTIHGTWQSSTSAIDVALNFCENLADPCPSGQWNICGVGKGDLEISFGSATATPAPVATSSAKGKTLTYNNSEADCYYQGYKVRSTTILLTCGSSTDSTFTIVQNNCDFDVSLTVNCDGSSDASGLSGGAIFLIIFFSVFAAYFIIGAILCKFVFKKDGLDIIPQRGFWCALPGLFIAGCGCAITKIKGCFGGKKSANTYSETYGSTEEI